jgi:hypothetical protein
MRSAKARFVMNTLVAVRIRGVLLTTTTTSALPTTPRRKMEQYAMYMTTVVCIEYRKPLLRLMVTPDWFGETLWAKI